MKKIAIIIVLLFSFFIILLFSFQKSIIAAISDNESTYVESEKLSQNVLKYKQKILLEMKKQGLDSKYLPIILAQVQQESSGLGVDIFQASESKYGYIGGIKSVDESIEQGIKVWVTLINIFEKNNEEVDIPFLLQTYNFGDGYFYYILKNKYKHSKHTAETFSEIQAKNYGWSTYGDTDYPENVLRYVKVERRLNLGELGMPFPGEKFYMSGGSLYGMRWHPVFEEWRKHTGLDFAMDGGTPISSIQNGIVETIPNSYGYGNFVIISNEKYVSRYAHLSKIYIKDGQFIKKGQLIGEVGTTGISTGNHLHLELFVDGEMVDPMYYIDKNQFTEKFIKEVINVQNR